tara:strand:- start:125 stop:526 length:402 start_codon:yes stop_codon:yes gene_type:complete
MFDDIIDEYITILNIKISRRFNIDEFELRDDWKKFNTNTCCYMFINGEKKGEMCENHTHSLEECFCKYHKQYNKPKKKKVILKKFIDNTFYHSITNIVFSKDKKVIGYKKGDKIRPLDEEHIELCKTWKFKII